MNKTKAIIKFCAIGVVVLLGVILCFAQFTIPFTNIRYDGCFKAIKNKMGIDLNGGILAVYDVNSGGQNAADLETNVNATIKRIENTLTSKNYPEATVTKQGTYPNFKIRIEVPGMQNAEDIVKAIGTPANIEFMEPTVDGDTTYDANKIFMDGKGLKKVDVVDDSSNPGMYALRFTFTDEGRTEFRKQVANKDNYYLTIFSNKKDISTARINDAATLGSNNTVLITSSNGYTKAAAEEFALQIESGLYSVGLSSSEMSYIPATLGEGAVLAGVISLLIGLVIIFVMMVVFYRDFGWLANLSLLIYTIIFLFALALIDPIQLTLPGVAGIILSIGMAVDANILIFEQIKEEYNSGKRFASAVHSGFNKSVVTILDANITTIIVSIILWILSDGAIKGFAITLALGVAISMFTGLVITRNLAKLYLYINPDNAARANIKLKNTNNQQDEPKPTPKRKLNMGGAK